MRRSLATPAILICGLLAAANAASQGWDSHGPGPKDMKSDRIKFTAASLMFSPSKSTTAFGLELENRSQAPIWVRVALRGPNSETVCENVVALDVKKSTTIVCPRDTIVPDIDYPMTVEVFGDSMLTTAVEQGSTQMRFQKKDLDELGVFKASTTLPRVYENVAYKKKLGAAAAVFGQLGPPSEGTLTVSPEGVEWKTKKQTVSVPDAQIRDVRMERIGPRATDSWVVVEYEEGGAEKIMALQPSAFRGNGPRDVPLIYASIRALADRR